MDLVLARMQYRADGIFGELRDKFDDLIAVTGEHGYDLDGEGGYYPKVPPGEYICVRGIHKLAHGGPFETFEIRGVPGHVNILFHAGNFPNIDSDGCVLLGRTIGQSTSGQMVTNSKSAFDEFMFIQNGVDQFKLTVLG